MDVYVGHFMNRDHINRLNTMYQIWNIESGLHFLPVVSLDDTSPKGEGSMRRYFCGEETGDMIGAHLLLLGEAVFIKGSNSRVLFRVAPQAILLERFNTSNSLL